MQTASCLLIINEFKSKIPKNDVTPGEVQLLIHMHHGNAGQMPIEALKIGKDIDRTPQQEKNRLKMHYIFKHDDKDRVTVESLYPGTNFKMPEKFEDIVDIDGNKVFGNAGSVVPPKIKVGDKEYTEAELQSFIAAKK